MTPSQKIIAKFGGVRAISRKTGVSPSTVGYWNEAGIPQKRHQLFFDLAKAENVDLKREEFFDDEQQGAAA